MIKVAQFYRNLKKHCLIMKFYTVLLFLFFSYLNLHSQNPEFYANSITIKDLKQKLTIYSSDEFQGRGTPSKGQDLALEFLSNQYKLNNIEPVLNGTYFQNVPLQINKKPDIELLLNDSILTYYKDYISYNNGPSSKIETNELVFVNYGIDTKSYSDYKDLNLKNKIAVAIAGEPTDNDNNYIISKSEKKSKWSNGREEIASKKDAAQKNGAKSLILINENLFSRFSNEHRIQDNSDYEQRLDLGNLEAQDKTHVFIFNTKIGNELLKNISKTNLKLSYKKNIDKIESSNVAAIIKGSEYPNEHIIITAHLDHVGTNDGEIYNGADDDGSGTVAILEIAEAFKKAVNDGNTPKRSIVFLHVTAEEKGLLGSQYYTDYSPLIPLKNTMTNLNIDMIGRTDPNRKEKNLNYIYLIGSDILSDDLHNVSERVAKNYSNLVLDYRYNDPTAIVFESGRYIENQYYYRSDHYNFAKNNIPIIFYFAGTHVDYHMPTDTVDKIEFDLLLQRTQLIFHTAWELANRDERIQNK